MKHFFYLLTFLTPFILHAQNVTDFIVVDQFGYLPDAQKIAIIRSPEIGYDAAKTLFPEEHMLYAMQQQSDKYIRELLFCGTMEKLILRRAIKYGILIFQHSQKKEHTTFMILENE